MVYYLSYRSILCEEFFVAVAFTAAIFGNSYLMSKAALHLLKKMNQK